ncbi:MAG: hypothetical protein AAF388_20665 [Bacteroidota bacterium]
MRVLIITLFLALSSFYCSSQIDPLLQSIIEENEVHYESVGLGGSTSDQYLRYRKLVKIASDEKLLDLTKHENPTVRCYASWGLVERNFSDLGSVFQNFLTNDDRVTSFSGCIKSTSYISSQFYHKYWNSLRMSGKDLEYDKTLIQLDSLVLYQEDPDGLLLIRALENRVYSSNFLPRIEELAFEAKNEDAIFYLANWHRAEYKNELEKFLIKYLKETNFSEKGAWKYLKIVKEIFAFKNEGYHEIIVDKLRADTFWRGYPYEEKFLLLLEDYYIYDYDLK